MAGNAKKTTKKVVKSAPKVVKSTRKTDKKKATIIGVAMIVLALALSVGTYAYYQTTITGTISGTILEWECTAGGSSTNFSLTLGDLYPGATGSWPIALSVRNFKANFAIGLSSPTNVDNLIFKHGNTVLCKSGAGNPAGCTNGYTEVLDAGTGTTGTATGITTITYEWPLGEVQTENIPSTTTDSSIVVSVVCSQVDYTPHGYSNS